MREYNINLDKEILTGLREKAENRRNVGKLVVSQGMYPENDSLRSLDVLSRIDTSALAASFPYPQFFVLRQVMLVCTETEIWEYTVAGGLELRLTGLSPGVTWSVADFGDYILMMNGMQVVQRLGDSKEWVLDNLLGLPVSTSVVNVNGQAVFAAPGTLVGSADI